jgi:hypothetical protein
MYSLIAWEEVVYSVMAGYHTGQKLRSRIAGTEEEGGLERESPGKSYAAHNFILLKGESIHTASPS